MRLGLMRDRITVERAVMVPNGAGGFVAEWQVLAKRYAEIIGLTGDESLKVAVERSMTRWRITLRCVAGMLPADRLVWHSAGGDVMIDIISALPSPKDRGMVIIMGESGLQ